MAEENPAAQRQTTVTAYFSSKQFLLLVFALQSVCHYSMAEENPAAQRQTTYLLSQHLRLCVFSTVVLSNVTLH